MKKNFFKKLSFVLALAMIVSTIMPAAGAFAATKAPKLNSAKQYLYLDAQDGKQEYDFNVANKLTGWKYEWNSSNEDVAVVEDNGLTTAVGVGTSTVSVVITKKGAEVATLSADVVVKDNIRSLTITNTPAGDKLAVGQENDFNRSFVTSSGSTTKTTGITRWSVNSDKATITDAGVFKATEAGDFVITARSFQSTAKYEAWKVSKDATLVTATKDYTVKVVPGITETKQANTTKFTVKFDSDMSKTDVLTAAKVYQVINGKLVATGTEKIKKIELDATGKVATVELYTAFNPKTEYNFVYGELVGKFTAATTQISDIAGIVFDDFTVDITGNTDMLTKISAVNKDGVVILPGSAISSYLTFTYNGDLTKGYAGGTTAYIYTQGYSTTVTAKYSNYVYNESTKTYDQVSFQDSATATGVKADTSLNASSIQYAVVASNTTPATDAAAWGAAITVPAGDGGFYIHTRYKKNNDDASAAYTYRETAGALGFTYSSSNTDKLLVSGNAIYPIAQGTATVIVKTAADGKVVGTFDVAIQANRTFAVAAVDTQTVTVGNNHDNGETKTATITVKDSMAAAFAPTLSTPSYSIVNRPAGASVVDPAVAVNVGTGDNLGKVTVAVTGKDATPGAYNIKVTLGGFGSTKDVYVTAIVVDGTVNNTVANWAVELGSTSVDLKNNIGDTPVTIYVYGYNSAGVRVDKLTSGEYTVTVKKGDTTVSTNNASIPVVSGTSGSALTFYTPDTYAVTAYVVGTAIPGRVNGAYIGQAILTVTDTTTKSVVTDTTVVTASSATSVAAAVKAAYTFKLNGSDITEAGITEVTYSTGATALVSNAGAATTVAGQSIYVSAIKYTVTNSNGTKTVYTFNVGQTISVQ